MEFNVTHGQWINQPSCFQINPDSVEIVTAPKTDFWQRTYYGFQRMNAPAYLMVSAENFSFTIKATFDYQQQYDQCGLFISIDDANWCKASIEHETERFARLGSVVTNLGYSDWATQDIKPRSSVWYRLHRGGPDFLIESSFDGKAFQQLRIFHLQKLGETRSEVENKSPQNPAALPVRFGVYACSPSDSSFTAVFSDLKLEPCTWQLHGVE